MADLQPPRKSTELVDPGAHELESSSDEHFSDASEGRPTLNTQVPASDNESLTPSSPIPITRVERVDDQPSHGEVPGTDAYAKRTADAVPDEVEVVPEGQQSRSRSASVVRSRSHSLAMGTDSPFSISPSTTPVPKTILERVDDEPAHGEVPGTEAHRIRQADAQPDVVVKAPVEATQPLNGEAHDRSHENGRLDSPSSLEEQDNDNDADEEVEDDFGDDFDDFEEGAVVEGDDDFGDFDDGFQEGDAAPFVETPLNPEQDSISLPPLDFSYLNDRDTIHSAIEPYINSIYPSQPSEHPGDLPPNISSLFTNERSASLYSQLLTPPPLHPPNWIRSRIRRLFLVSLGVPVDLDEILPASKQKKLVLPNVNLTSKSPRPSSDATDPTLARLKESDKNDSQTSIASSDSKSGKRSRARPGPPPPPELDLSETRRLCSTTTEAMQGFEGEELQAHLKRLEELQGKLAEVEKYWIERCDSARREKEAFEAVIENLVGYARRVRK